MENTRLALYKDLLNIYVHGISISLLKRGVREEGSGYGDISVCVKGSWYSAILGQKDVKSDINLSEFLDAFSSFEEIFTKTPPSGYVGTLELNFLYFSGFRNLVKEETDLLPLIPYDLSISIENEISFILMYEVGIVQRCQENVDKRFFLNELLQQLRLPTTV